MQTIAVNTNKFYGLKDNNVSKGVTPEGVSLFRLRAKTLASDYKKKTSARKKLSISSESVLNKQDSRRTRSQTKLMSADKNINK